MNGGANFREFCHHPDFDAVYAELQASGSLTPSLNYYRANVPPETLVGPPIELPSIQSPTMGIWGDHDFALLEEQMAGSAKFCASSFRFEPIEGADHWVQLEQPERVNELLLDFLPR